MIDNYEEVVTPIPCSLSEIPDLLLLTLDFNCWDKTAQRYAPWYLLRILETIDTETTQILLLEMIFHIKLEAVSRDSDGFVHLNLNNFPSSFHPTHGSICGVSSRCWGLARVALR